MSAPAEYKTAQARILAYAEAIGWTFVSQKEAEQRRRFDPETPIKDRAKGRTLFFENFQDFFRTLLHVLMTAKTPVG